MEIHNEPIFISIEGNIGSGKSTLLAQLKQHVLLNSEKYGQTINTEPNIKTNNSIVVFIDEPLEIWEKIIDIEKNRNILELYYENKEKYAFVFQTCVITTQKIIIENTLQQNPFCKFIISERSIDAALYVFAKMLKKNNIISQIEYEILILMAKNNGYKKLDHLIYLNTTPEICMERIQKRNRDGENNIPLEYLIECERHYKDLINQRIINGEKGDIKHKIYYFQGEDSWALNQLNKSNMSVIIIDNNDLETILPIIDLLVLNHRL
jgi:deoxyadenosine/deoxycytidine kinase